MYIQHRFKYVLARSRKRINIYKYVSLTVSRSRIANVQEYARAF